jgi:diguanylate cyclase (GGDEF)-like protein/PAS domain S-box-containing protein
LDTTSSGKPGRDRDGAVVYWLDSAGCIVEIASAPGGLSPGAAAERVGEPLARVVVEGPHADWDAFQARLQRERVILCRGLHRGDDGAGYPVDVTAVLGQSGEDRRACLFVRPVDRAEEQDADHHYRLVIETAQDGFWVIDGTGRLLEVNEAYCRMSGFDREELLSMSVGDLEADEDPEAVRRHIARIRKNGSDFFVSRHVRKNGEVWPVEVSVSYSPVAGGRFLGFVRDIENRLVAQEESELKQLLAEKVYQGSLDDVMRVALDTAERVTDSRIGFFHFVEPDQVTLSLQIWSTRTLREMCFAEGEGLHYPVSTAGVWVDCIHQRRAVIHNDYEALPHKKGLPEGHAPLSRELTVPIFRHGLIVGVIGVGNKPREYTRKDIERVERIADMAFDFIERKRSEMHVAHLAYYDALTDLPNRMLFADRLNIAMKEHKRSGNLLAVCYIDLNEFKPVNDRFGHDAGDHLLRTLARRLANELRGGDTLARLGGDEFALLLTNLSEPGDCEPIVRRLLGIIAEPVDIGGNTVTVTGSIGATIYPFDDAVADTLLRHADLAMYQAKVESSDGYRLYDPVEEVQRRKRRQILTELERALAENELVVHYQPRIDLASGALVGAEALVRWLHPERGLVLPGGFLPEVVGTPLEAAIDRRVLDIAMQQYAAWLADGLVVPLGVNIGPNHIQQEGFHDYLAEALAGNVIGDRRHLELEIVETGALGDLTRVVEVMRACKQLGVTFALDDFGTGYASLSHFHRLPVDTLKIDRSFVANMLQHPDDLAIVEGTLKLAEELGRPVVAEGVESPEIGLLLLHRGCRYAQGFGIARPISGEAYPAWAAKWAAGNEWHGLDEALHDRDADIELSVAILSHRNWAARVDRYVRSADDASLPPLGERECSFWHWFHGIGKARYGSLPMFAFLPPKHANIHQLAEALVRLVKKGRREQALRRLPELATAVEEFVATLQRLAGLARERG